MSGKARKRSSKKRKLFVWACVLIAMVPLGWEVNVLRHEARGLQHIPSYLISKFEGTDLYSKKNLVLKHGNRDLKEIALTIDDGPHPESMPQILSVLRQYNVHATFFPVGKKIKEHPELVREMVEEGHEVGNHTQDHIRLTKLRPDQIKAELRNADINFYRATGRHTSIMRPPGMSYDDNVLDVVRSLGYVTVSWTSGAKDFIATPHQVPVSPLVVGDRILSQADRGGIILVHDAKDTAEALPHIIRALRKEGYTFVTISEMLAHLPNPVAVQTNAGPLKPKELAVLRTASASVPATQIETASKS